MPYLDELRRLQQDPAPIGVVGIGRMGRGIVDQVATMPGLRVRVAADLDGERALRAFTENGWDRSEVVLAETADQGQDALRRGKAVATADPLLVPELEVRAVVESTGSPETGARVADLAIARGRHAVMLNVEADIVVGPLLAERARQAGVVYTLAAGDQPGAIFEMVEWARCLGFEIVCAGRGTVLYPDDHHATPEKYRELAERNRMNPKMYNEFRDGTKSQLEMVAVSNVLKMPPVKRGMLEPHCKWQDLGKVFALRSDGGLLEETGVVDMANAVGPNGEYVHEDKVFPGVFIVVTSPHPGVRSSMGSLFEPGFGGTAQQWGPAGLFRPYHLACVEVPMSVARAVVEGRPTGDLRGGMVAELVAVAKRDLAAGEELDGGGGYTVYGLSERYEVAKRERLLPFGFAYEGTRLRRPVARDQALSLDDVELDEQSYLWRLRQEQVALFG